MDLQAKPYTNLDETARVGISSFIDCAKDDAMNNTRRPGLGSSLSTAYQTDLGESKSVDSVYEWNNQGWRIDICNGKIFKTTKASTTYTTTEITGATLKVGVAATFADFGDVLFIANGGKIIRWAKTDVTCAYLTDTDAPTKVSFIGFINQYLFALDDDDGLIKYSEAGSATDWPGEFFDAERVPDKTKAILTGFGEVVAFGTKSVEFFGNTSSATQPWLRYEGKIVERGTIAPYSIKQIDNGYFFLDHERKIVKLVGSEPQVISNPFDSAFQALDTIEDARGMHIIAGGDTYYVVTFPTEQKTYAYDYKRDVWAEWSYQNNTSGNRENFLGRCSCYMTEWNQHFVGSRLADGYVYLCSKEIYQDGGSPTRWELITGWEGDGTLRIVPEILIRLKRGKGAAITTPEPILEVYYRDSGAILNGSDNAWKGPRNVNLGQLGEEQQIRRIRQLGQYRTRQYRFVCSGNVPIVLIGADETYG